MLGRGALESLEDPKSGLCDWETGPNSAKVLCTSQGSLENKSPLYLRTVDGNVRVILTFCFHKTIVLKNESDNFIIHFY